MDAKEADFEKEKKTLNVLSVERETDDRIK